ncbi:MAG TPA: lysyl oxidase family protein [Thermoleophilaceae bacterium]|nr:lysyl oxidase family protein [Thermoleophilaceae bacterium]
MAAALVATVSTATLAAGAGGSPVQAPPVDLLPDLDQQTPTALRIANIPSAGRTQWVLGFQSAVRNIGAGPLVIDGRRGSANTPLMRGYQRITRSDGSVRTIAGAGRLRYAISPTHQHWHLLHFDRYELRRADGGSVRIWDQKTGFCLGDRYRAIGVAVAAAKPDPTYLGACGLKQPGRLSVEEGISPGYGDNYLPYLEGQSLPLTGLKAGRYLLVHRTNSDHALAESDYGDNAASVLVDLRRRGQVPVVNELAACPNSATCSAGPLSASLASAMDARPVPVNLSNQP